MELVAAVFIAMLPLLCRPSGARQRFSPGVLGGRGRTGTQLCSWQNHLWHVFWLLLLSTKFCQAWRLCRLSLVPTPPTMVYPTWTTGTRGGAFTWVPLPLGPGQHSRSSGSSTVNQAPWLHFGVTCRVQCLCVPAHSGAGLNNRRLSLARSALPASLPWVLQSELQTAEPFRFPQGSSERGWGHGVRLQSQPVRQKPGKDKIGQCLFWKARQLLWYVKSQSPRRSKVKRYLSLLFDFSLVPDPSLVLHSTLWDRKPSGWKGMRDFFLSLSFPLFFAKCWICIK